MSTIVEKFSKYCSIYSSKQESSTTATTTTPTTAPELYSVVHKNTWSIHTTQRNKNNSSGGRRVEKQLTTKNVRSIIDASFDSNRILPTASVLRKAQFFTDRFCSDGLKSVVKSVLRRCTPALVINKDIENESKQCLLVNKFLDGI